MTSVGKVETLVAQREVRDLISRHRYGKRGPVPKGRINDLVPANAALIVAQQHVRNLAAPPFLHGNYQLSPSKPATPRSQLPGRKGGELLADKFQRALDFYPSQQGPGEDVPRPRSRYRDLGVAKHAIGMVVPDVPRHFTRTSDRPDQPMAR